MSRSKRREKRAQRSQALVSAGGNPIVASGAEGLVAVVGAAPSVKGGVGPSAGQIDLPAYEVAFWNQCQSRAVGYLTTNGTLQIALCGMFATVGGVLVSQADFQKNEPQFHRIYLYVLPVFCGVVLALSGNVYSWIVVQLAYIRHTGVSPERLIYCPTYDEYKALLAKAWKAVPWGRRFWVTTVGAVRDFVSLPLRLGDIYCYYMALYVASGVLSLAYGHGAFEWWFPLPFLAVFALVTHSIRRTKTVVEDLPTLFSSKAVPKHHD